MKTEQHSPRTQSPRKGPKSLRLLSLLVISTILILVIQQNSRTSEAKKIKLKDLKKVKKYAYLLAGQSKKFYAIPFPLPLPVFVKRQQIYTQVPIVPRYVQQPQGYSSVSSGAGASSSAELSDIYAAMSAQAPEMQSPGSHGSEPKSAGGIRGRGKSHSQSYSNHEHYDHQHDHQPDHLHSSGSTNPSRYLAQLANTIGHAYPVFGASNSQRDLIGKILNGQARLMTPGRVRNSVLSTLRHSPIVSLLPGDADAANNKYVSNRPTSSSHFQSAESGSNSQKDSGAKRENSTSSSKAPESGSGPHSGKHHADSVYPLDYPTANDLYRLPSPAALMPYSPFMAAHSMLGAGRLPAMLQPDLLQMMDPQMAESVNPLFDDQLTQPGDLQEAAGSSGHLLDIMPVAASSATKHNRQQLLEVLQKAQLDKKQQQQLELQQHRSRIAEQQAQQQQALRSVLAVRQGEEAAAANLQLLAAQQMGLRMVPGPLALVNY